MSRSFHKFLAGVFILLLFCAALVIARRRAAPSADRSTNIAGPVSQQLVNQFTELEAKENELNKTVWAKEILAEECARVFESLWDSLNAATNKFSVLQSFQLGELVPGNFSRPQKLADGIELREPTGVGPQWSEPQWGQFLEHSQRAGWELAHIEFRHNRFDTDEAGRARQSHFYFSAHLTNAARAERAVLEGDLIVDWAPKQSDEEPSAIKRIDASHLTVKTRRGEPAFRQPRP